MLARWRAAGLVAPTLLTLVMLPVLIVLGTWQWHRLHWKEGLIHKLETRTKAEPVSYAAALASYVKNGDVEYLRVRVSGIFDHSGERHLYAPRASSQGWDVFTPLVPDGGLPPVYVNRGWVRDTLKDPSSRAAGQVTGPVTIVGIVRKDDPPSVFAAANDPEANQWYSRDTWAMRWGEKATPLPDEAVLSGLRPYAPFSLDAEASPANPGGWPKGGTTEVHLPNSHLQYVVTWYGLAVTLIVIFVIYARQRLAALDGSHPQP
jgi:surfeit locus 1 family protein